MSADKLSMGQATVQRQREQDWKNLPRFNKLARTLYPNLSDDDTRKAQASFSASEGKRPPKEEKLLSNSQRGATSPLGGQSKWSR